MPKVKPKKKMLSKGAAMKASAQGKKDDLLKSAYQGAQILGGRAKKKMDEIGGAIGREVGEDVRQAKRGIRGAGYMLGGPGADE
jgi:hypothetical protein